MTLGKAESNSVADGRMAEGVVENHIPPLRDCAQQSKVGIVPRIEHQAGLRPVENRQFAFDLFDQAIIAGEQPGSHGSMSL